MHDKTLSELTTQKKFLNLIKGTKEKLQIIYITFNDEILNTVPLKK